MIGFVVVLLIVGLVAGSIARLLVPGRDPVGFLGTIALGVLGSFAGGFVETLIQYHTVSLHQFHATGLFGSIVGALILLVIWRISGLEPGHRRRGVRGRY